MADFANLSDSDDDRKVEALLAQALDHSVLEQVSAINCAGFTDPILPNQLESRFSRLKSFPSAKPMSQIPPIKPSDPPIKSDLKEKKLGQCDEFEALDVNVGAPVVETKLENGISVSPAKMSGFSKGGDGELGKKMRVRNVSFRSPSDSRASSRDSSPSPTRAIGCFWCSPKRVSGRKSKEYRSDDDWGKNEEVLSDISDFSAKGQEKLLKKMMKEEEKINREAAKIVKWAKQVSARMELSDAEDEMSDHEGTK
ncbi:hypothetical protein DCAR_0935914 [Daucus carota subsp. sativus]|uniref:Uncharacterized protein n=1 Tax=Daucus carota subsp. sativus TaxID=79200 RepID=A0A175YI60_DAUCS|nr:PREDICTED: uncharacterized protein LOC108201983 [Daucus carota subsp. sativus]WOH16363.1 hypothetical protein DCAR_0935914 [Daucus carota subsp. sativus]